MAPSPAAAAGPAWRWAAVLGLALLVPAGLPAGGGERRSPDLRRRESRREPLLSGSLCALRCAPRRQAPVLAQLEAGVPLRVLRCWQGPDGACWWRVEGAPVGGRSARGWLAG